MLVVGLGLLTGGCGTPAKAVHSPETQAKIARPTAPATATPESTDMPVRLHIPAITVDAAVEQVGILASGDLDTPQQHPLEDVGWYNAGPHPGERGSSVIDGHLDGPGGVPAVFWYLSKVQAGDEIIVDMSSGKTLHFQVTGTAAYAPKDAPLQTIFGDSGGNYLNLITCAGYWIPSEHQTTLRRVVYTTLEQ